MKVKAMLFLPMEKKFSQMIWDFPLKPVKASHKIISNPKKQQKRSHSTVFVALALRDLFLTKEGLQGCSVSVVHTLSGTGMGKVKTIEFKSLCGLVMKQNILDENGGADNKRVGKSRSKKSPRRSSQLRKWNASTILFLMYLIISSARFIKVHLSHLHVRMTLSRPKTYSILMPFLEIQLPIWNYSSQAKVVTIPS